MKNFFIPLLICGSLNALASSYDFSEKTQTHCTSTVNSDISVSVVIQNETYIGWYGYALKTLSNANVKVRGIIDSKRVNINETVTIETHSRDRITNAVEYTVSDSSKSISEKLLASFTGDETTPGKNIKIIGSNGNANLVHAQGVGFVSLNIGKEHLKTLSVRCSESRDTADNGRDYLINFQKI